MKNKILIVILVSIIFTTLTKAQDPLSFFPHGVGDRWEYVNNWGQLSMQKIVRDSIGPDNSHNLFYNPAGGYSQYRFRIDTALNVFEDPQSPNWNYLLYKLGADVGDIWENPISGELR
ncbi:MAG: hypothetical protein Q8Q47_07530, partial [Ignavibacteriaceae bacterium]|nr:hypothetical protein [Ignavibacteriaceae bacterium]